MTQSRRCTVNVTEGLLRIGRSIVQLEDVSFWCHNYFMSLKFEPCVGGIFGGNQGNHALTWAAPGWQQGSFTGLILGKRAQRRKWWGRWEAPGTPFLTLTISRGLGGSGATTTCRMEWNNFIGSPNKYFVWHLGYCCICHNCPITVVWLSQKNFGLPGPYFPSLEYSDSLFRFLSATR